MGAAIGETNRRREKQVAFNEEHGIVPRGVTKAIADVMEGARAEPGAARGNGRGTRRGSNGKAPRRALPEDAKGVGRMLEELQQKMMEHARNLEFEDAAAVRDEIRELRESYLVN